MEPAENFVITVPYTIDCTVLAHITSIMKAYGAVSTGNQFGGGVSEYFFAVAPHNLSALQKTLSQQIHHPQIIFSVIPTTNH